MRLISVLGLTPFLIYFLLHIKWSFYGLIPLIVYINGILYHGFYPNSKNIRYYDIIVNAIFCIYINIITPNQPYIFIVSFFTTLVFLFNTKYISSSFMHVLCIQWVLLQLYIDS